jgi:hypothetical protein
VRDPDLVRRRARRASTTSTCARCRRSPGHARRRLARIDWDGRHVGARRPGAPSAPSSTRCPGADGARLIPAVSTRTNVWSPRRKTVSIASRVVPAARDDHRSSPSSAEQARLADVQPPEDRDRISSPPQRAGGSRGHRVRRSPVPPAVDRRDRNRIAESSRWNSGASASRPGSSILLRPGRSACGSGGGLLQAPRRRGDTRLGVDDEEDEVGSRRSPDRPARPAAGGEDPRRRRRPCRRRNRCRPLADDLLRSA